MNLNRLTALIAFILALAIMGGQFFSTVQAAPTRYAHASISAQLSTQTPTSRPQAAKLAPADQFPYAINVQGRLTDASGNPITVATAVVIKLYDAPSGGIVLYSATTSIIPDANGLFSYALGSDGSLDTLNIDFSQRIWLGITVGSDSEMTPRLLLSSAPYALSLAAGSIISGQINGSYRPGVLTVGNTNPANGSNGIYVTATSANAYAGVFSGAGGAIYAQGQRTAVEAYNTSSGSDSNYGGLFMNSGSGSGQQYGVYGDNENTAGAPGFGGFFTNSGRNGQQVGVSGATLIGYGVSGFSAGSNSYDHSVGVAGESSAFDGFGGVFTGSIGLRVTTTNAANTDFLGDGIDVASPNTAGTDYAIYSPSPVGTTDYTVHGAARILGSNITAQSYDLEVQYNGSEAARLGDVLVADGSVAVADGKPIVGVVKASAANRDAAIGILSQRLQPQTQGGHSRFGIDPSATTVRTGDRAYITVVGVVQVNARGASVGQRLAVTAEGLGSAKSGDASIGKLISAPDTDGKAYAFVNFK